MPRGIFTDQFNVLDEADASGEMVISLFYIHYFSVVGYINRLEKSYLMRDHQHVQFIIAATHTSIKSLGQLF